MPRKDLSQMPLKTEPRCNVCQCASRTKTDKLIAAQFSDKSIAEELIMSDPDFHGKEIETVRKNVERHRKRHVDIRSRAIRDIVERRAKEQGILIDSVDGQITSGRALLDLIIARGTEQLALNPEQRVKFGDAIEAVKMLEDVQKAEFQAQLEVMQRQVWAISESLKKNCPPTLLPSIIADANFLFENPDAKLDAKVVATPNGKQALTSAPDEEMVVVDA